MFNRTLGRFAMKKSSLLILLGVILILALTIFRIGSATKGLSPAETTSRSQSSTIHVIYDNPVNGVHKVVLFGLEKTGITRHSVIRISSYLFALLFAACFYYLCRSWFGRVIAILATLIFCLSPFFLIPARLASPEIMFFFPVLLMAIYCWMGKTEHTSWAWLLLILASGLALYTPGMFLWLLGGAIYCRKKLGALLSEIQPPVVILGFILLLVLVGSAVMGIVNDWHIAREFVGVPSLWSKPLRLLENVGWMGLSVFARTPYHTSILLGRLPLLSLIQLGLMVFGAYALWTAARAKAIGFGLAMIYAVLLAAVNNNLVFLLLGLPAAGILMAAGLRYLYIEWQSIFPRNPIPKALAIVLMSALVAIQLVYGLTYSLVAWPHSPDTKAVYVLK
ncbi:glycosyltransferase family 39 protein [Candidatus Saccharibacteria bacterium]|nr:glycosyltransferase family 39 protein [Candidatus Saccharibacteria bacterium]